MAKVIFFAQSLVSLSGHASEIGRSLNLRYHEKKLEVDSNK